VDTEKPTPEIPMPETPPHESLDAPTSWTIAVSGASGLIGSALVGSLRGDGHRIRRLTRSDTGASSEHVTWNPDTRTLGSRALDGVDAVVHLAGETVGERWNEEKKRRIRESRVKGTQLISAVAAQAEPRPRVLVSASAVGIYGDRGDEILDEESDTGPPSDFLAQVGREWEAATEPAERHEIRVVHLRFGVVLSEDGGALQRMLPPFRLGVGGKLGSGRQWMSWIALDDIVAAIRFAMFDTGISGPVNVTSPNPVTNAEFTRTLGRVLGRPTVFTVPAAALRIAFGEMADATLLASQRAAPRRLIEAGFRFRHPDLEGALRAELQRPAR
jgi:uncharacterized protein